MLNAGKKFFNFFKLFFFFKIQIFIDIFEFSMKNAF